VTVSLACAVLAAALQAPSDAVHVRRFAGDRVSLLKSVAGDAQVLRAVQAKNAAAESPDQIRRIDEEWSRNTAFALRKELTGNACAARVRELTRHDPSIVEVIVMDRQGANVCVTRETSDYWQGDEPKFKKTFGEARDVFVDAPAFDASSGVHAIQVGATMFDGRTPVGAVTFTLRVPRGSRN
jgi:hypothetical protein